MGLWGGSWGLTGTRPVEMRDLWGVSSLGSRAVVSSVAYGVSCLLPAA